ncbi:type IV pilus twitching motility protein PilT [[Clostridium] polysaccharolyticum]|uniref:Twitching motility protein PilT n=1 Tax=[Clostridium] polysaccharolyticum TaxID=29364 RepID=A0A1H9ZR62_9FIRM|nr:type IV pilus twitching motility protein PilT [[Clostridium] polysaccharolyticum]SES84191.1 twitching motility protein PilT [[Clostridium] polysaccharolyticum]
MITINDLLRISKDNGASDLHITVGVPPKCRINGDLKSIDLPKLMPDDTETIISPILGEHQKEVLDEFGEVDFAYSIPELGRYRVNVFKQRGSLACVIRLVGMDIPEPDALGITPAMLDLTNKKRGLVLVTGPTGSGKTTTLASLIDQINRNYASHIITLEDPIEYLHSHNKSIVNQREVGLDTSSYSHALRSALREDPDVILVGEMRDLETISTAITAAETGHLVFSTLHTIGAAATIDRAIDVFPPNQQQQIRIQLATVLEAVISQTLIPATGGKGRVAVFEVMLGSPAIKNLIRENKTFQIPSMMQTSKKMGMQTLDDAIYDLYLSGKISAEHALNYSQDPIALERKLY